jgi:hypothetical protein
MRSQELQGGSQPFVDRSLETRRQSAGTPRKEAAVERQELGDVNDGLAYETGRTGRQQDVAGRVGELQVEVIAATIAV